jgi:formate hydrogenlyase transcriptional activator
MVSQRQAPTWLLKNGPKEIELLFRAMVFHPSVPILLVDDDRYCLDASVGASRLLGAPRGTIIGRTVDDFAESSHKPVMRERWGAFLEEGEQEGKLRLIAPHGVPRDVEYSAKANVLPVRHLLVLHDKAGDEETYKDKPRHEVASWVHDYALFLLDTDGHIVTWYAGAQRIFGYKSDEVLGQDVSLFYADDVDFGGVHARVKGGAGKRQVGAEGWNIKKDGSRFWANVVTMALNDENGVIQGFAKMVRDFSARHERDEVLRHRHGGLRTFPAGSTIAGIVSGEFDRISEANDAFLDLVGYSREDLQTGRLSWPDLTPQEYAPLDELAHEEAVQFGACTPFEKELIRNNGTRVPVLFATAVLKLAPFRWITFVQDLQARDRLENLDKGGIGVNCHFEEIVGTSMAVKRVMGQIVLVAPTSATVLILGETGTGKELVARAIHRHSPRKNRPFVTLNCAAIPTGLLESELFGYERGAFTGALSRKIGRFELANGGTLFLDEVGDIPLDLQPKLLRALQEKAFERLGGTRTIPIDVRLVAATNQNLVKMMGDKLFRSDLYYRLRVFPITIPPLRDHPEDIPLLARHFTKMYAGTMDRTIDKISPNTMRALVAWQWPGNVRELENFIERSVILSGGRMLSAPLDELRADTEKDSRSTLQKVERDYILQVFRESRGVVSTLATRLGVPRTTLNALMKRLGISRRDL